MSKESAKLSTAKLGRSLWSWREAVFGRCKCRTSSCRPAAWWKVDQAQACLHFCPALALHAFFGGLVQLRLSFSQIPCISLCHQLSCASLCLPWVVLALLVVAAALDGDGEMLVPAFLVSISLPACCQSGSGQGRGSLGRTGDAEL